MAELDTQRLTRAAEQEAELIVATARDDVRRALLKAQQDLLLLDSQVQATLHFVGKGASTVDLSPACRQRLGEMLQESRGEQRRPESTSDGVVGTIDDGEFAQASEPVELGRRLSFGFLASASERPRAVAMFVVAAVVVSALLTAGWWLLQRPQPAAIAREGPNAPAAVHTAGQSAGDVRGTSAVTVPAASGDALTASAERWLDAYYRQDHRAMAAVASPHLTVSDERAASERLPAGLQHVTRTLEEPNVQRYGSDAIVTGRMSERTPDGRAASIALISQLWTRRSGEWRLTQVRIVSAAAAAHAFR